MCNFKFWQMCENICTSCSIYTEIYSLQGKLGKWWDALVNSYTLKTLKPKKIVSNGLKPRKTIEEALKKKKTPKYIQKRLYIYTAFVIIFLIT